jgi:hypothetical protein
MDVRRTAGQSEGMGITNDRETPAQVAHLIHYHHRSPTWRLGLASRLLGQLARDAKALGFTFTAAVLDLAATCTADATGVAPHLEVEYTHRLEAITAAIRRGELGPDQAPADVTAAAMAEPAAARSPHDLELPEVEQRVAQLDAIAADLDAEATT